MSLPHYGLLTGSVLAHGDQHGGNPHYLITVEAGGVHYRVAVNLKSTIGTGSSSELQYQIIPDLKKGNAKAKALAAAIPDRKAFQLAGGGQVPTLDFVRGGFLDPAKFLAIDPKKNKFYDGLVAAANQAQGDQGAYVAVFGTGYGGSGSGDPTNASFGFSGVDNIHMNQGSYQTINHHSNQHYAENGPNQDGAVLFCFSDGTVQGFFSKFQSQDIDTDAHGNPLHTNVKQLDSIPAGVAKILTAALTRRKKKAASMSATLIAASAQTAFKAATKKPTKPKKPAGGGAAGGDTSPASGFIFNDPAGAPSPSAPFKPDDDSNVDQNFVDNFAKYGVPEPVPGPRDGKYPTMTLEEVVGSTAVKAIQKAGKIVIHTAGDTGAATEAKLPYEMSVGNLMMKDFKGAAADQPAFFYHLGDVVYYFGEQDYYYDQFYKPYRQYPRPIFAIPGNHDGITYSKDMESLAPFKKAFCDATPEHWNASGGISRTTMTQPGVYFTLDAPFVSIIGLYSNCSESYGYLDQQQTLFLYNELVRLKPKRKSGELAAVLLAVHHPPMSYSPSKPSSLALRNDIDTACNNAGFWPDAIFSGHAHVYQRMTRTVQVEGKNRDIPHLVCGAGGYNINPQQEVDKADMKVLDTKDPKFHLHQFLAHYGYMKLTVTPQNGSVNGTLRMEFLSPNVNAGGAADTSVLDLQTHQLTS